MPGPIVALLALAVVVPPRDAGIPPPGTLSKQDFTFSVKWADPPGPLALDLPIRAFNRAHCVCDLPLRVTVDLSFGARAGLATAPLPGTVEVLAGNDLCLAEDQPTRANARCRSVARATLTDLASRPLVFTTSAAALIDPDGGLCRPRSNGVRLWVALDANLDSVPDLLGGDAPSWFTPFNGEAPPAPTALEVAGADRTLDLRWTPSEPLGRDFAGYVVLCAKDNGEPAFKRGTFPLNHDSRAWLCPSTGGRLPGAQAPDGGAAMRGRAPAPPAIAAGDPLFLCSDLVPPGTLFTRISGLEPGTTYQVGVAAVDRSGNASPVLEVVWQATTGEPAGDGGVSAAAPAGCNCAFGPGRPPAAGALLGVGCALALWRRRRR
jgi:hypothetical protein